MPARRPERSRVRPRTGLLAGAGLLLVFLAVGPGRSWVMMASDEVRFSNGDITLAGTVLRPRFAQAPAAAVFIHGSGPVDRSSMEHTARTFVRNGYAALIYDKRGVGESEGSEDAWRYFSIEDLAADAAAGFRFLRSYPGLDHSKTGIVAVSQGGWVAPLVAAQVDHVAFIVAFSASVSTVAEDRIFERQARLRFEGFTDEERAEVLAMHHLDNRVTRTGDGFEEYVALWKENEDKRWFRRVYLSDEPMDVDHRYRQWERTVLDHDPVPVLRRIGVPAFWLYGDPADDRFAPVDLSVERLGALRRSGQAHQVQVFEGYDHSLQRVDPGLLGGLLGTEAPWPEPVFHWLDDLRP